MKEKKGRRKSSIVKDSERKKAFSSYHVTLRFSLPRAAARELIKSLLLLVHAREQQVVQTLGLLVHLRSETDSHEYNI